MGLMSVVLIAVLEIFGCWIFMRRAAQRWWDYLIILVVAAFLFFPMYNLVTGDMSRILPNFLWSDGPDGKDQIILASIVSTFLLPLILSSLLVLSVKIATHKLRAQR